MKKQGLFLALLVLLSAAMAQPVTTQDENGNESSHQRAAVLTTHFSIPPSQSHETFWYCVDHGRHGSPSLYSENTNLTYVILRDEKCVQVGRKRPITLQEAIAGKNPVLEISFIGSYGVSFTSLVKSKIYVDIEKAVVIGDTKNDEADLSIVGLVAPRNEEHRDAIQEEYWLSQDLSRLGYLQEQDRTQKQAVKAAIRLYQQENGFAVTGDLDYEQRELLEHNSEAYLNFRSHLNIANSGQRQEKILAYQKNNGLNPTGHFSLAVYQKLEQGRLWNESAPILVKLGYLQAGHQDNPTSMATAIAQFTQENDLPNPEKWTSEKGELLYQLDNFREEAAFTRSISSTQGNESAHILAFQAQNGLLQTGKLNTETQMFIERNEIKRSNVEALVRMGYIAPSVTEAAINAGIAEFEKENMPDELYYQGQEKSALAQDFFHQKNIQYLIEVMDATQMGFNYQLKNITKELHFSSEQDALEAYVHMNGMQTVPRFSIKFYNTWRETGCFNPLKEAVEKQVVVVK